MVRESRFSQWMRRRHRTGARGRPRGSAEETARAREGLLLDAAAAGFPLAPAAHPSGFGCSCVRIGCPTPGRHPVSFGWQTQATTEPTQILRWARTQPQANFITATGHNHDVLDVPQEAGEAALDRLESEGVKLGPVAVTGDGRMLFFTATRAPVEEDEWWPCELDCHPETMDEHPGLRWHCRGSYVLVPPARLTADGEDDGVRWVRAPQPAEGGQPTPELPEPLSLLEALTDACAEHDYAGGEETAPWPVR
ncbi:bifunctional DNA primase/polymerase [Streptomyces sp. ODS28]|uniref:bifunctional DNA primase/polymerase n=1 Tax=Streptomyces sp. ODS28 TaxID=3136688 RepID=UPI0031EA32AC